MPEPTARRRLDFSGLRDGKLVAPASLGLAPAEWQALRDTFDDCIRSVRKFGGTMAINVYLDEADVDCTDPERPVRYPKGTFSGGARDWNPPRIIGSWSGPSGNRRRDAATRRRRKLRLDRMQEEQRRSLSSASS